MPIPPRKYAPNSEVLWCYTSPLRPHAPRDWRTGTIANGKPEAPFFSQKRKCWLYPVIVDRPTGPRILYWVRENDISGSRKSPERRLGRRPKAIL
ncbi:hypothetical protein GSI_07831 [Ganoderma sinense ZZ0214-1]|uniref:Uncharacterized protein n=1 Tax=Ganoderma sinense ZZ0214-1 TaxID=1077348 RepID=A0A2G8S836_9APHY|nr:hypothetical protein GSI_07831 [Ganoderma sinense ZZ0214-1]